MAKDPAFLFYPGDWLGGTMGMTFEQKGAYFELLLFQFNNGRFTEAQAKQVLSICDASVWHMVKQKFSTDGAKFWSQRLETEIDKRKKFSESRRNNANSVKTKKVKPKEVEAYAMHMENENENRIEIELKGAFDEIYLEKQRMNWAHIDFEFQYRTFCEKVRGSPEHYQNHESSGLRLAFQKQLREAKQQKSNGKSKGITAQGTLDRLNSYTD